MSKLVLIPYIEASGEWTIPDGIMMELYELMVKENTAHTVFYSGTVKNGAEFIRACQANGTHTAVVFEETGAPVAVGWLNNFTQSAAHAHWLCFKRAWGTEKTDLAISETLKYWFHFENENGPLFEVLLGIYPEDNRFIDSFARRAGFTIIGAVPKLLYNFWEDRQIGAIISYIERRTICHSSETF